MRMLSVLAVGAIALTPFASPFALPAPEQAQPLQVSAKLEEQTYCPGDNETFAVHLKLRLYFMNRGSETLIVSKDVGKEWYEVIAARTHADLARGRYEYAPNIDWFTNLQHAPDGTLLRARFSILVPGESFGNTSSVSVVASFGAVRPVAGTLRPGKHILQLRISTWNYVDPPEETRKRWEPHGQLFSQTVTTEPVAFEIPAKPSLNECR